MTISILVIDDNDITMDLMIYLLNALGYSVVPALNGPAGLAIAKSTRPNLILCDIQMPELDGFGVLDAMKADPELAYIPIVAITAMATMDDEAQLLARGFDGYVGKPIDVEVLKAELNRLLLR